jgi:hypothetical protein
MSKRIETVCRRRIEPRAHVFRDVLTLECSRKVSVSSDFVDLAVLHVLQNTGHSMIVRELIHECQRRER